MYLPPEGHNLRSRWVCLAAAGILTIVLCGVLNLFSGLRFNPSTEFEKNNLINFYSILDEKTNMEDDNSGVSRENLAFKDIYDPPSSSTQGSQPKVIKHKTLIPELLLAESSDASSKNVSGADFVYRISDLDAAPIPIIQGSPSYPRNLLAERVEGKVIAILSVDEEGNVFDVEMEKEDYPELAESARVAIFSWKFLPGRKDGKEVKFRMRVPIIFRLKIIRNGSTAQANNDAKVSMSF